MTAFFSALEGEKEEFIYKTICLWKKEVLRETLH